MTINLLECCNILSHSLSVGVIYVQDQPQNLKRHSIHLPGVTSAATNVSSTLLRKVHKNIQLLTIETIDLQFSLLPNI